jgi:hypothetical protein
MANVVCDLICRARTKCSSFALRGLAARKVTSIVVYLYKLRKPPSNFVEGLTAV